MRPPRNAQEGFLYKYRCSTTWRPGGVGACGRSPLTHPPTNAPIHPPALPTEPARAPMCCRTPPKKNSNPTQPNPAQPMYVVVLELLSAVTRAKTTTQGRFNQHIGSTRTRGPAMLWARSQAPQELCSSRDASGVLDAVDGRHSGGGVVDGAPKFTESIPW